jgi:predicted nuclease of restriction endonuclease-like (RecB) superfamily
MGKLNRANKPEFENILRLINEARNRAFNKVNTELVMLYFSVGDIVSAKVTAGAWGDSIVDELATFIETKIPGLKAFNRRGLYRMKQFYETYNPNSHCVRLWVELHNKNASATLVHPKGPKNNGKSRKVSPPATQLKNSKNDGFLIVSPPATQLEGDGNAGDQFVSELLSQLSWTNHLEILSATKTAEEKLFYIFTSIKEKWSKTELRRQLNSAYFERTMLGNNTISTLPEANHKALLNVFKDPYIFDFLDLPEQHSESDLEHALSKNLQKFILEIGKGFTYMGAQFRLQVGKKDYHSDLLFYHRDLQCLVLFELKVEEFQPEFLGKLNFYLEALDRDVKRSHEKPSIGILLCKEKDNEVVKYAMARNMSPAMIADYETKLINKKLLANKLHELAEQLKQNIN